MKRKLMVGLMATVIAACTSQRVREEQSATGKKELTILYQSNRWSQIEPCGCTVAPYGGVDREKNALDNIREGWPNTLYVDSGNMFVPLKEKMGSTIPRYHEKAKSIVAMMNAMKLEYFSPGPRDYELGVDRLQELEKLAEFPFISSNVKDETGKLLFKPYALFEKDGVRYAIVAVTPDSVKVSKVTVEKPSTALSRVMAEVKDKSDMIILLSQLGADNDQRIGVEFPDIRVIVGADPFVSFDKPVYFNGGRTLLVDTNFQGNLLGRLDLEIQLPFKGFYSETLRQENIRAIQWREEYLKKNQNKALAQSLSAMRSSALLEPVTGGTLFEGSLIKLDKGRFGTPNELTTMVKAEKERVRKRAISE